METNLHIPKSHLFGSIVLRALEFAALAHEGQRRRGTAQVPYISHPAAVGLILARAGFDDAVVAAGVLHDVIEDTPVTAEELSVHFGEQITEIVLGASEDKSLVYDARKAGYVEQIRTASAQVKAVSCADKIANLTNLIILYEAGENAFAVVYPHNTVERVMRQAEAEYEAVAHNFNHPIVEEHRVVLDVFLKRVQAVE